MIQSPFILRKTHKERLAAIEDFLIQKYRDQKELHERRVEQLQADIRETAEIYRRCLVEHDQELDALRTLMLDNMSKAAMIERARCLEAARTATTSGRAAYTRDIIRDRIESAPTPTWKLTTPPAKPAEASPPTEPVAAPAETACAPDCGCARPSPSVEA